MSAGKLYTISEASAISGISAPTLRYWERMFSGFFKPRKTSGNQRRYDRDDLNVLFMIRYLLKVEKYTIGGAKRKLRIIRTRSTSSNSESLWRQFRNLFGEELPIPVLN